MAFPSQQEIDIIATKILLDTKQALSHLKLWNDSITDGATKMRLFKELIKSTAAQMDGDMKKATAAVRKFASSLNVNPQVINKMGQELQGVSKSAQQAGSASQSAGAKMESAFQRVLTPVNALRIALGALVSMILFQAIQAFQNLARNVIENLEEVESAVFNIINAEQRLSEQGIEIAPKDLEELIEKLQILDPLLSKIQATELVSAITTKVAPALGLGKEQIDSLAQSISILSIRNRALGKSFEEVESQVITGLLSGRVTQGINQLGVKLTDQIVKQKAVKMELVETEEAYDKLSAQQQEYINALTIIQLLEENTQKERENLPEFLKTASGQIGQLASEWSNFVTALGEFLGPLLKEFVSVLIEDLKRINEWLETNKETIVEVIATITGLYAGYNRLLEISREGFVARINPGNVKEFFKAVQEGYQRAKEGATDLSEALDTPTGPVIKDAETEESLEYLEQLDEKLQDIMLDAQQAQEDLDLKLEQKQSDLDLEYIRKAEDAAVDHNQKLEDINQDAIDKAEDAKNKARETELKAEEDLLQKLKELRQRFLLDLEDALRARDARQVIRLIKEYKLDKQNILDRAKLDEEQRKRSLEDDLRAIEIERQRRIAQENIEYQRRLADLATAKAREQEELALWYKREQDDIQRNIEQKIQKLLAGYIAEEKLHAEHQAKIAEIIAKYVGYDMAMVDRLAQFMANRFAFMSGLVAQPGSLNYGLGSSTNPFAGSYADPLGGSAGGGVRVKSSRTAFAEGGTLLANRPTTVMFGERGPEAATFTPLNRTGLDAGKVFGDIEGGGVNGTIMVAVELSPDLEGRVVRRSMDGVANIISRVNNRKM